MTVRPVARSAFAALDKTAATASLRAAPEDIPDSRDLYSAAELAAGLAAESAPAYSVIVVGDIMLGGRTTARIEEHGADYPFAAVGPLLARAPIVVGNIEGPLARHAELEDRRFSYKVDPSLASSLRRAGINVGAIPNNHLMDCGRSGVIETLDALRAAGVTPLGAGLTRGEAHAPVIMQAGSHRVGLLAYYWNERCAATATRPGGATDTREELEQDISALRAQVDRVVVSFHWGVPYERDPAVVDRAKARLAIDLGADVVVGHHPHIIQPLELYGGRPIFYSTGNFTFGSGNSQAESLLIAIRFEDGRTVVDAWPVYVKNRDLRVDYQPKVLRGAGAEHVLRRLAAISGVSGPALVIANGRGRLTLANSAQPAMPNDA